MKLQLDIPKDVNKALKLYTIQNDFKNLQDAVNYILNKKLLKKKT